MVYNNLTFPSEAKYPYFYSNFVATVDGKVQILENTSAYWPLGSKTDYETLIELRTYADVLIHGSTTALFHPTSISLSKEAFHEARKRTGRAEILYVAISNHPSDDLIPKLASNHPLVKTMVITSEAAKVPSNLAEAVEIVRLGKERVDVALLSNFFAERRKKYILVEGGPNLMGSFYKAHLIDEIFLTIAPKVVGNEKDKTISMVEGYLYPPSQVPSYDLVSCIPIENEVYLRYRKPTT
jgi:riboflavin biosynthesis pyrimidine reductase